METKNQSGREESYINMQLQCNPHGTNQLVSDEVDPKGLFTQGSL